MTEKTIRSIGDESTITINYGGGQFTCNNEVHVKASDRHWNHYFDGPALRDALLEAFPLRDEPAVAAGDEPAAEELVPEPEFLDVVPGCVIVGREGEGYTRVCLSDGRYYNVQAGVFGVWTGGAPRAALYRVAFDPRKATALPNPLGIRVGDRVRRTTEVEGVTTTVEFEVNHIGTSGLIAPRYGLSYNPKGFEVVSRVVPGRPPAGTIVRLKGYGDLRLITDHGGVHLSGYVHRDPAHRDPSDYARLVRDGDAEVVYLP